MRFIEVSVFHVISCLTIGLLELNCVYNRDLTGLGSPSINLQNLLIEKQTEHNNYSSSSDFPKTKLFIIPNTNDREAIMPTQISWQTDLCNESLL